MLTPLSSLLSTTWSFFQKHLVVFLAGAVVFGLVNGFMQSGLQTKVASQMNQVMGVDPQKFQELSMRASQGDTAAMRELEEMGRQIGDRMGETTEEAKQAVTAALGMQVIGNVLPAFGIAFILTIILQILAMSYYSLVSVRGMTDIGQAFTASAGILFPLMGLWIWTGIRTFVWIPIIGFIFGIILGPRFIAGPVLLIRDGKGVLDAASESYKRTGGHWGKIFGNMFVVGLLMAIASAIIMALLSPVGMIGMWIGLIVQQVFVAFGVAFSVELSKTVLENPKMA